jgi:hypothetical protein
MLNTHPRVKDALAVALSAAPGAPPSPLYFDVRAAAADALLWEALYVGRRLDHVLETRRRWRGGGGRCRSPRRARRSPSATVRSGAHSTCRLHLPSLAQALGRVRGQLRLDADHPVAFRDTKRCEQGGGRDDGGQAERPGDADLSTIQPRPRSLPGAPSLLDELASPSPSCASPRCRGCCSRRR